MTNYERALSGLGVCLELSDRNGRASFFYLVSDSVQDFPSMSALCVNDLIVWLAENGYVLNSDGSMMVLAG